MKVIKAKQSFKTVSAKQVETFPALADKFGTKRPAIQFDLPQYEQSDLELLSSAQNFPTVLLCVNQCIAQLAKDKFAAQPENWNYIPTEDELSLAALAKSFETVSRGRVLTLESAGKLATWLTKNLPAIVTGVQALDSSYTAAQAQGIVAIVAKYTAYESKSNELLAKVVLRLDQFAEAIGNRESLAEDFVADPVLSQVFDALVRKFTKDDEEEISADAL